MTMRHFVHIAAIIGVLAVSGSTEAAELAGAWKGVLSSPDGSRAEVQIDFSPQGLPLYSYTNNKGVTRQVELSHVGQTIEYVPPGGGVQRMAVKRFDQGPGHVSISIIGSFERASQGYMDQRQEAALFEYTLVPEGMKMRVTTRTASHFGDKDLIVGGDPSSVVAEGVLHRLH